MSSNSYLANALLQHGEQTALITHNRRRQLRPMHNDLLAHGRFYGGFPRRLVLYIRIHTTPRRILVLRLRRNLARLRLIARRPGVQNELLRAVRIVLGVEPLEAAAGGRGAREALCAAVGDDPVLGFARGVDELLFVLLARLGERGVEADGGGEELRKGRVLVLERVQ